jgi:hypothetical protein
MKVKELIKKLNEYNPEANFYVIVNSYPKDFEICFGTSEGCTKENCDSVDIMVNCESENC